MLECSLQLSMEQGPGPKTTAVDRHWVSLLNPVVKLMCIELKHEESCMGELCLIETDFSLLFPCFTL